VETGCSSRRDVVNRNIDFEEVVCDIQRIVEIYEGREGEMCGERKALESNPYGD
jgi:hypothetical protein